MPEDFKRYAIYFAPQRESPLASLGNQWLGVDPGTGEVLDRPRIDGISSQDIKLITKAPSRYGFHGTLKPPFVLRDNRTLQELDINIQKLAEKVAPFDIPKMTVRALSDFLAIVPASPVETLNTLADRCVKELDDYRKPASDEEIIRRRKNLTARQEVLLMRWGYPFVMEEFRFHLTLTGRLSAAECAALERKLTGYLATALEEPVPVRDICLFGDPGNDRPFRLLKRYPLRGGREVPEVERL
ncbi:DUF1045 domain-containing protein [uncultured Sneathiella sp.]|uniref:DUF1045 domain-containing protein n=1 Tax=uncultured Sneathiella sp. TaxID=879315 RepID=UPI0030EC5B9D|tara:strand:+ start:10158 stop:10886 length:729 start_codon:yes stop_codon:yes gene_type:complete